MPRNVRNFWLELTVDGKSTRVETGPMAKDGGFKLVILQRDKGSNIHAMEVQGRAKSDGTLILSAVNIGAETYKKLSEEITVVTDR